MTYEYIDIVNSFNLEKIHFEILNSSMSYKSIESCTWHEKDKILKITFTNELTVSDKTILDEIISSHDPNFPEGDFNPLMYLFRLAQEFTPIERKNLAIVSPSFITELTFRKFDACKVLINEAYTNAEITEVQMNILKSLFSEQNITIDNY